MFLLYLLVLLLVVDDLLQEQVFVILLARVLYLELLLLVCQSAVLLVQVLGHVSHVLQVVVEGVFADARVLIILLLLQRVRHQLLPVLREGCVQLLPHHIFLANETPGGLSLQHVDRVFEVVEQFVDLVHCLLLGWPLRTILNQTVRVHCLLALNVGGGIAGKRERRVILPQPDAHIFELFLILTFVASALQGLLANPFNFVLHVLNDFAVLLLPKDVIVLLCSLGLLQLLRLIVEVCVDLEVLLIQVWPVLSRDLES